MSEEQVYSLDEAVCPVTIGKERYLIVEADGAAGTEYRNATAKGIKFSPQGKPCGVDGIVEGQLILVAKCLFKLLTDNDEKQTLKSWTDPQGTVYYRRPVNFEVIRSWPDRVTQGIFEKARELSGMSDEDKTAKNS